MNIDKTEGLTRFEIPRLPSSIEDELVKRVEAELAEGQVILERIKASQGRGKLLDDKPKDVFARARDHLDLDRGIVGTECYPDIEPVIGVGSIWINGIEYHPATTEPRLNNWDELVEGMEEVELSSGTWQDSPVTNLSGLRSGYQGGNTPNIFKDLGPCAKVNYDKVAKRRAKNKAARKTRRK